MSDSVRLLSLIRRYLEAVSSHVAKLRGELGQGNLLRAVSSGLVPREGVLRSGARYAFHGVGCLVEDGAASVDFDFGPEARCDGFDAWRLWQFAQQLPELAAFHELAPIESGLRQLREQGHVTQPRWEPSPHLWYLTEAEPALQSSERAPTRAEAERSHGED